jgi:glycosyltransferase involved in cell wall biosynthesis
MKVIVQIPCYNEEATLPQTIADIPRRIDGVDVVEILIIDDGSTDRTLAVARAAGVDHIVRNRRNRGLARTFRAGIDACLALGADIIVNTDADNQYSGADIPRLVAPILSGQTDIVIGDRETSKLQHFSWIKRLLQGLGSGVVRQLAGISVPDTVSGFRAYSREAALRLNVLSSFSYTVETVIQAGVDAQAVSSVPIRTNGKTRESRLFKSTWGFLQAQATTIVRVYAMYQPLIVFSSIGVVFLLIGILPIARFLYFFVTGDGEGHIQSLLLGAMFVILAFIVFMFAMLADLIQWNRKLIESTLVKLRRVELELAGHGREPSESVQRSDSPRGSGYGR